MTNGEKIQTILDVDRDCTEVYGENGTMTFAVTQDFWNSEYKEPGNTIDYRRAFKIACDLLNGDILYGVDTDKIYELMMQKDGVVSSSSYEEYILNHLQELDQGQYVTENCIACKYDETEEEDGKHCKKCLAGDNQFELDKEFVEPTTKNDLAVAEMIRIVRESDVIDRTDGNVLAKAFNYLFDRYIEEPITKNYLGVSSGLAKNSKKLEKNFGESDCISRIGTIDYLCKHCPDDGECFKDCDEIKHLRQMPSVTPQEPILDKVRAEIEKTKTTMNMFNREDTKQYAIAMEDVLKIIDKYKAENEE